MPYVGQSSRSFETVQGTTSRSFRRHCPIVYIVFYPEDIRH